MRRMRQHLLEPGVDMGFHILSDVAAEGLAEVVIAIGGLWRHAEVRGDGAEESSLGGNSHNLFVASLKCCRRARMVFGRGESLRTKLSRMSGVGGGRWKVERGMAVLDKIL